MEKSHGNWLRDLRVIEDWEKSVLILLYVNSQDFVARPVFNHGNQSEVFWGRLQPPIYVNEKTLNDGVLKM